MNLQLPTCKSALQRLVGMFAYYARWISQFSERIRPFNLAITCNNFPLSKESTEAFESLKDTLLNCCLSYIRDDLPFQVDCVMLLNILWLLLKVKKEDLLLFFQKHLIRARRFILLLKKKLSL